MRLFQFISAFLLIINQQQIFAQDHKLTIYGTVQTNTGIPIPMTLVHIINPTSDQYTDNEGNYILSNIKIRADSITIIAYTLGYSTLEKNITINIHQDSIRIDFILKELNDTEVEIVSNQIIKKDEEGYAAISIETKKFQSQSIELNRILDQAAGVKVRQEGGLGSRSTYALNGLGGKSVRFFLDGIPMDYFGSSYSINTIPISLIDRIDIYKGVVPVELGSDALGGAINLISKKQTQNGLDLSYSYGSFNTHRASLFGNFRDSSSGFSVKLAMFYNNTKNNYTVWGNDIYTTDPNTFTVNRGQKVKRFHDAFSSQAIKADVGFSHTKFADQLYLGLLVSGMNKDIQHGTTMKVVYGKATYSQQVYMPYLTYKKTNLLVHGLDITLFSGYTFLTRSRVDTSIYIYNWDGNIEGVRTLGGEQSFTLNTLTEKVFLNRVNLSFRINNNHKLGLNIINTNVNRVNLDPLITHKTEGYWAPQLFSKQTLGLVYESKWFNNRLTTSLFSKYFSYSAGIKTSATTMGVTNYSTVHTDASGIGYGIATAYNITPYLLLSASLEKAYRLPEPDEVLGDGIMIVSTTDLKPEKSTNINLGYKLSLFQKKTNNIVITGNFFYRDVTDLIQQWQYDAGSFVYTNFNNVLMKGFDGGLKFAHKKTLSFTQTLSYLQPIIKSNTDQLGNENIVYNERLPNTPFLQMNTNVQATIRNIFQQNAKTFIYWNFNYVGSFFRFSESIGKYNKDIIPVQLIHSCGVGYTFPKDKLTLSMDLNNILNEQVFDNFAVQKPGRAVYVKCVYRLEKKNK
ncbi:TonB-dependent receptor plug domain-containing protein [uncultured Cytophaga sp.]|uniref:TonB-dependent receptor n=1 Tax=uncultured Cytophaga sp. TaxID=160238 RepID=UPI0026276505|nr:TonB-dependent receptor plug domain-containing protein [uncultured Cytophaga sp.]